MQGFKNVKGGVLKMLSLWPETPCDALLISAKKAGGPNGSPADGNVYPKSGS